MTAMPLLIGLIGTNIMKSLSPALHEDAMAAAGLRGFYQLIDLDHMPGRRLEDVLLAVKNSGFGGVNITSPCQQAVMTLVDEISAEARQIGAVSTITISRSGRMIGHNTDCIGFQNSFEEELGRNCIEGQAAVLVGADGVGRAVACALMKLGAATVVVHDTDRPRASTLVADMIMLFGAGRFRLADNLAEAFANAAGVVNTTPIGTHGFPGNPVPSGLIRARHWVADINYSPVETKLIKVARAAGARVLTGGGMCVHQAAAACKLFCGVEPDTVRMHRAFDMALNARDAA